MLTRGTTRWCGLSGRSPDGAASRAAHLMDPITLVLAITAAASVIGPILARGTVAIIQAHKSRRGQSVSDVLGDSEIQERGQK